MKKSLILGICIILLLPFINAVPSEIQNKSIYSSHIENGIKVDWYEINNGLTHKEFIYSVDPLGIPKKKITIEPFIDNAIPSVYDITNFKVYEYKLMQKTISDYYDNCTTKNIQNPNGTIDIIKKCNRIKIGEHNETYWGWEEIEIPYDYDRTWINWITLGWLDKMKTKIKRSIEDRNIDNIKYFKVTFEIPVGYIEETNVFGNLGRLGVLINGVEYHPWWNSSFSYRIPINITNKHTSKTILAGFTVNVSIDTQSLISEGKLEDNEDTMAVACLGIERNRRIENWDSANTVISFMLPFNISVGESNVTGCYIYFGNTSSVSVLDNYYGNNVYIYYGNFTDNLWADACVGGRIFKLNDSIRLLKNGTSLCGVSFLKSSMVYGGYLGNDIEFSFNVSNNHSGYTGSYWSEVGFRKINDSNISMDSDEHYNMWDGLLADAYGTQGELHLTKNTTEVDSIYTGSNSDFVRFAKLRITDNFVNLTAYFNVSGYHAVNHTSSELNESDILIIGVQSNDAIFSNGILRRMYDPYPLITTMSEETQAPTHTTPILNTSQGLNTTNENLTCWNQSTNGYGNPVKNIYGWYLNNHSIMPLNLPFEGGSNDTYTKDYSGLGNDAVVTDAIWNSTGGHDGFGAYEFNETNYIEVDDYDESLWATDNKFTVSFWYKSNVTTTHWTRQYIIRNEWWNSTISKLIGYRFRKSVGEVFISISDGVSSNSTDRIYVNDNNWHHIAGTWNGTEIRLYVDGALKSSKWWNGSLKDNYNPAVDVAFYINTYNKGAGHNVSSVDDIMVFNRSLSEEQIVLLNNSKPNFISSSETDINEIWKCSVTPNSINGDGDTLNSTELQIRSSNLIINNLSWNTTDPTPFSNSTLNRQLIIDYVYVQVNDSISLPLKVYLNVTAPNGTLIINSVEMTNSSYSDWRYNNNWNLELSGQYNLTAYVDNGFEVKSTLRSIWSRDAILSENSIYNSSVVEGSVQGYSTNVSYNDMGIASITAELIYNSTSYTTSRKDETSGYYFSRGGITTPIGVSSDNFRWNFTIIMDNGNSYTNLTEWKTVTFYQIGTTNCTQNNQTWAIAYNLTLGKEMNNTKGNWSNPFIAVTLNIYSPGSTNYVNRTFYENDSEMTICILQAPYNNDSYRINSHIEYGADGYDKRNYFHYNNEMNNITQNLTLYLLEIPYGTETRVIIQDQDTQPLEGYFTKVQRYYVEDNAYKLVAMLKSDEDGRDIVYLREDDAWYRFVVEKDGEVVYVDPTIRKITRDAGYSYATVTITINLADLIKDKLQKFENIEYNLSFNNLTNNFVLFYSDTSGGASAYCLYAYRVYEGETYFICDKCSTSSSATILCNVGQPANGTYYGYFYAKGSKWNIDSISFVFDRAVRNLFGNIGIFVGIFVVGTASFIGAMLAGTVGSVILPIASLYILVVLKIIEMKMMIFMGILALAIGIIIGLKQEGR